MPVPTWVVRGGAVSGPHLGVRHYRVEGSVHLTVYLAPSHMGPFGLGRHACAFGQAFVPKRASKAHGSKARFSGCVTAAARWGEAVRRNTAYEE